LSALMLAEIIILAVVAAAGTLIKLYTHRKVSDMDGVEGIVRKEDRKTYV